MATDPEKPKKKSVAEQGKTIVKEGGENILKKYSKIAGTDAQEVVNRPAEKPYSSDPVERKKQKDYNMEKYGTTTPTREGKRDTVTKVPGTPGELNLKDVPTPGEPATQVDTFKPWEQRQSHRRAKVSARQERQIGRQTARRLHKGFKKGDISPEQTAPGSDKTYGEIYKEAKIAKAGGGATNVDPYVNPSRYDNSTQGTVYNPSRTKSVSYGSSPTKGKPSSSKTKLSDAEVANIKKATDFKPISKLKGHNSGSMYGRGRRARTDNFE